jgi:hypothetical protein
MASGAAALGPFFCFFGASAGFHSAPVAALNLVFSSNKTLTSASMAAFPAFSLFR